MSTQEIANRLVELCRSGNYAACYKELYSDNAVSIEGAPGPLPQRVEGLDAIYKKGELWNSMIEAVHGSSVGDPIVGGNTFACTMMIDCTMKGQPRMQMEEVCVYQVEDGKIVSEQFFF